MAADFITINKLKNLTPIHDSVDDDLIRPHLTLSQDKYTQPILGTKLYNRLQAGIVADDLNADEVTLLSSYIQPALAFWCVYDALPFLSYKLKNGDVLKHVSEESETISKSELEYLRENMRDNAEFYTKRLLDYLCEESSKYPEYNEEQGAGLYPEKSINNYGGMYLGGRVQTQRDQIKNLFKSS